VLYELVQRSVLYYRYWVSCPRENRPGRGCSSTPTALLCMQSWGNVYFTQSKVKQSLESPEHAPRYPRGWGSQIWRQSRYECGKVVSSSHRPRLPSGNIPGTHFFWGTESTPGPQCGRNDYANEIFQWHHRKSNPWPQPTTLSRTPPYRVHSESMKLSWNVDNYQFMDINLYPPHTCQWFEPYACTQIY